MKTKKIQTKLGTIQYRIDPSLDKKAESLKYDSNFIERHEKLESLISRIKNHQKESILN